MIRTNRSRSTDSDGWERCEEDEKGMMDHICLHSHKPSTTTTNPPPILLLLYCILPQVIIQASLRGVLHPVSAPPTLPTFPFTLPRGRGEPPHPHPPAFTTNLHREQGLTKHFLSFYLPCHASLQPPHPSWKYLTPPPKLFSYFFSFFFPMRSITLKETHFIEQRVGRREKAKFLVLGQFKDQWKLSLFFKCGCAGAKRSIWFGCCVFISSKVRWYKGLSTVNITAKIMKSA